MEIWKDVVGYEKLYKVSNLGNVKSLKRKTYYKNYDYYKEIKGIMLSKTETRGGYLIVGLHKNGKHSKKRVNRLVAEAFIPNPKNKKHVNHINEKIKDNRACNLNWMTPKENANHGTRMYKIRKKVIQLKDGVLIKEWESATKAGNSEGISISGICQCCRNEIKTYRGFNWKYI